MLSDTVRRAGVIMMPNEMFLSKQGPLLGGNKSQVILFVAPIQYCHSIEMNCPFLEGVVLFWPNYTLLCTIRY